MLDTASPHVVNVLMYHSISDGPGPTCIPRDIFREQLNTLQACGYQGVPLNDFYLWQQHKKNLPEKPVVITFDDGFLDFYQVAFPELERLGWTATVYLPTGRMGACEDWEGSLSDQPRSLMSWPQVEELASCGIDFGGHTVSHADLTKLSDEQLAEEIRSSKSTIHQFLGADPLSFAAPYGKTDPRVQTEIGKWYRVAVGVQLAQAEKGCDSLAIPRIEMHYFRNARRWTDFLHGRHSYFNARRFLRYVRHKFVG